MRGLKKLLLEEQKHLESIVRAAKGRLDVAPSGTLRLSKCQNKVQYYHFTGEKKRGSYIAQERTEFIQKLAQKSYDEKVLWLAERRLAQIKQFVKEYEDNEFEKIFNNEHPERQKLIQPVEANWEQLLKEWKAEEYQGKEFQEGAPVILTEKGERVRSKTEKIMADYFYRNEIEYKYECPLYLRGIGTVYPDFTFLSPKNRMEIYWEHNGKMDDPAYAKKAIRKIQAYESNNIFPGEQLILTYETEKNILNTRKIEQMVERYLR